MNFVRKSIIGTSAEDADDVVQKTLIKAARGVENGAFREGSNLKSWLYKIAQNNTIDLLRKKHGRFETVSLQEINTKGEFKPSHPGLLDQDRAMIKKDLEHYLDQLSPERREIMVLVAEGLSNQEIAARLGIPVMTVGTRIFRALKFLKELAKNEDENI